MMEFKQKFFTDYYHYKIEEEGISYELKVGGNFSAKLVHFDNIFNDTLILRQKPSSFAIGFFFSFIVNIILIYSILSSKYEFSSTVENAIGTAILMGIIIVGIQIFKFRYEKRLSIIDGSLPFYYGNKEKNKVDEFIKSILDQKKQYFRKNHMIIDSITPTENLKSTFLWMKESKYISEEELENLIKQLEERDLY